MYFLQDKNKSSKCWICGWDEMKLRLNWRVTVRHCTQSGKPIPSITLNVLASSVMLPELTT